MIKKSIFERYKEISNKLKKFSKYEVIVIDKLYGMIFVYLTGTPCIELDNLSKKPSFVYEWIADGENIVCLKINLH